MASKAKRVIDARNRSQGSYERSHAVVVANIRREIESRGVPTIWCATHGIDRKVMYRTNGLTLRTVFKIADALNIPASDLLAGC